MEGRAVMDPNQLQTLIDGYMQGSLSSADQAEFDSRFASDPTFSEKVTGALGSHVGDAPNDFVDGVASRLDARWENIFQKGTRSTDSTLFVGSGVLVAALVVLVGAGWYVWKTLGSSPDTYASQSAASSPKVVLSFKLPSAEASSWKPKMTFADAERDFTHREIARSGNEKKGSPTSQAPEARVLSNGIDSSQAGQILRIRVEVPRDLQGRVTLWNAQGQMVRRLFEGAMPHGTWALDWDQKNDQGLLVQTGSYAVHIEAGGQVLTGQVIVTPGS
jgi:hypothetical protein